VTREDWSLAIVISDGALDTVECDTCFRATLEADARADV
jgi:hypothetical protein